MAKAVGVDHLVIRVSDFETSKAFYNDLLGFLGYELLEAFDDAAGWRGDGNWFWIQEADEEGKKHPHRTGNVGFHHYAFELSKREDVDELHQFLLKRNAKIVDAPADYPDYGEGYYAVFFLDPDNLKLEGMFCPPE